MAAPDQDTSTLPSPDAPAGVLVREGDYGDRVMTVEPGGAEFIPLHERHGRPLQLFWTWTSPNLEFATVFVGVLGVALFGLSFWQTVLAILIGTAGGRVGGWERGCVPLGCCHRLCSLECLASYPRYLSVQRGATSRKGPCCRCAGAGGGAAS